jgi:hypothetical protein
MHHAGDTKAIDGRPCCFDGNSWVPLVQLPPVAYIAEDGLYLYLDGKRVWECDLHQAQGACEMLEALNEHLDLGVKVVEGLQIVEGSPPPEDD